MNDTMMVIMPCKDTNDTNDTNSSRWWGVMGGLSTRVVPGRRRGRVRSRILRISGLVGRLHHGGHQRMERLHQARVHVAAIELDLVLRLHARAVVVVVAVGKE